MAGSIVVVASSERCMSDRNRLMWKMYVADGIPISFEFKVI